MGYILSFGLVRLRTIRLSARAGAHIEIRCSRSCVEDVTITDVIIKTPHENGTGMPGSDGLGILDEVSRDSDLDEASPVVVYRMRRTFAGSVSWDFELWEVSSAGKLTEEWFRNSQHSKNCVSLSPRVEKLKDKKVIKVSYLN